MNNSGSIIFIVMFAALMLIVSRGIIRQRNRNQPSLGDDNSLKLESVKALIMQAMPLIDGQPQKGQELEVLGGLGID